jgi:hypothetical protein
MSTQPIKGPKPYLGGSDDDLWGASSPGLILDVDGSLFDPFADPRDDGGGFASPPFDPVLGGTAGITLIDGVSLAKSGGGGGGGGKPSGGGGTTDSYWSGIADGDAGYDIHIDFTGSGWDAGLKAAFEHAADYYTTVITKDVGTAFYHGKIINDLYVTAELKAIDGTGGILGQAGPKAVYTANDLTAVGQMQFDVADAVDFKNLGLWDDIVTHELTHVLGFGSLWNFGSHSLVYDDPDPTHNDQYKGLDGLTAYKAAKDPNAAFIPVEADGGSGTAGSHWDEAALGNELMTGYINQTNYLSDFSVMSLGDLGYTVGNYQPYIGIA